MALAETLTGAMARSRQNELDPGSSKKQHLGE